METEIRDFFEILREIKIDKIISDYQAKYSAFYSRLDSLKKEILKQDSIIIDDFRNRICNKSDKKSELEKIFIKNLSENNKLDEWFEELMDLILEIIVENRNRTYNKIRKYKLLYFLYGLFVYYRNSGEQIISSNERDFNFFENNNIEWCAFAKGPIINTFYQFGRIDKPINIDLTKFNSASKEWEIFVSGILTIEKFSTDMLIDQSHKTYPWEKHYEPGVKFKEIPLNDIISYFKKEAPFFVELNN